VSSSDDAAWETGWDGHEAEQLRRLAALTFAEKLEWLEEAQRLLVNLSAARQLAAELQDVPKPGDRPVDN
jgi:hypothetical protein